MNFMNEDWCVFWWNMSLNVSTSPVSQVWFCVIQAPFHICLYLRMLCERKRKKRTNERLRLGKRKQRKSNNNRTSTRQQRATLVLVHFSHFHIYCLFFIVAWNPLQLHRFLPTILSLFCKARMSNDFCQSLHQDEWEKNEKQQTSKTAAALRVCVILWKESKKTFEPKNRSLRHIKCQRTKKKQQISQPPAKQPTNQPVRASRLMQTHTHAHAYTKFSNLPNKWNCRLSLSRWTLFHGWACDARVYSFTQLDT